MSTSRVFAMRSSALRNVTTRVVPRQLARPAARRGYADAPHKAASKSSDLPWLIGSVGITGLGAAFLLASGPQQKEKHADAKHDAAVEHAASHPDPAAEENDDSPESKGEESKDEVDKPGQGDPKAAHKSGQTGRQVPPPSADNSDLATNWDEKKEGQEQYKEMVRQKDTKVAASSSTMPSKKTATEDPREDPKKGEGEAVQKGGPAE
ncbi:Uu.00g083430.m01.CDS01 [Anthostomella pinea]|uniref:Uu.00g083430.m01.CDS01 n=1 Tax=Anthostomella pinea TaxID=933095 RepID=A0AAI8YJM5_9PEZI|nr:Uu.00g083430.m01.CDS01 [Anthostomella pinea]